jgi:hypothetical protein
VINRLNVKLRSASAAILGVALLAASAAAYAATPALQAYTAPDKSASAGVPSGWKITNAQNGVITMAGPQGEQIGLGAGIIVRNGNFQAGASGPPPVNAIMPNNATLPQKLMMVFAQAAAQAGQPAPQVNILSATPIGISAQIAQCGVFLGTTTTQQGASKFEAQFCSLVMDSNGFYKLVWKMATIPSALATQERATAEAVLHSYKIAPASLKVLLQPLTQKVQAPAPRPTGGSSGGVGAIQAATLRAQITSEQSFNCMDLGVIREVPERQLPSYCR